MRSGPDTIFEQAFELFSKGRLSEAASKISEALASNPAEPSFLVLAGAIGNRLGSPLAALYHLDQALGIEPLRQDALVWKGLALYSLQRDEEAIEVLRQAVDQNGDDVEALNLLGIVFIRQGQPSQAVSIIKRLLRIMPESAQAFSNLGMAYRLQNAGEEALEAFKRAVELDPRQPNNFLQLFKQLQQLSREDEAIAVLESGLRIHPKSDILIEALAVSYGRIGKRKEAEQLFDRIQSQNVSCAASFATWLQDQGRFNASEKVLLSSILTWPDEGAAYHGLADANCFTIDGTPLSERIAMILPQTNLHARSRMHLEYALGKSLDHSKEYELAMGAFDRANKTAYELYPACRTFSADRLVEEYERLKVCFAKKPFANYRVSNPPPMTPIFVVGMIRSGTTLLDRILSSHLLVDSAGELPFWNVQADTLRRRILEDHSIQSEMNRLTDQYSRLLTSNGRGRSYVVDKMPLNFRHLDLICAAIPMAKILHIRRNPVDTCLSIYMTFFAGGPNFTYKKSHIVAYYRAYLEQMNFWRSVLSADSFHEVDYENLVSDPDSTIRSVIEFCGLPWSDDCLRPDENKQQVSTPSRWQVRQPIYRTSLERWRRYEPWLGEFRELQAVNGHS